MTIRKKAMRFGAGLARASDGGAAVEFAMVLPALLILLFGIIETGRVLWMQGALDYSVDAAARCASIDVANCGSSSQIQSYAAAQSGAPFSSAVFTTATPACGSQVAATYPVTLNIPFATYSVTLTAQSCYPK